MITPPPSNIDDPFEEFMRCQGSSNSAPARREFVDEFEHLMTPVKESKVDKKDKKDKKKKDKKEKKDKKDKKRRRSRSSGSADSKDKKKRQKGSSGWDEEFIPNIPQAPIPGLGPPGFPSAFPDSFANRRARELYIGGLTAGHGTRTAVRDYFQNLLSQLPEFQEKYASHQLYCQAVKEITISEDGSFAFVEFFTEELAATVIDFDGVVFGGRALKIGRPAKFVPTGPLAQPMDVTHLRTAGILPPRAPAQSYGGGVTRFGEGFSTQMLPPTFPVATLPGIGIKPPPSAAKKQRELYVGNLQSGLCNEQALKELFTPACAMLPEYIPELGPPVTCVDVRGGGTFAFVEFQNEQLATAALGIFDKMDVGGRSVNVGRPSGYNPAGQLPTGTQAGFSDPLPPPPPGPPPPPPISVPKPPVADKFLPAQAPVAEPNYEMNAGAVAAMRLLNQ